MEPCEPRGSCTDLREAGGEIPSAYSPVRANVFGEDRPSPYRLPAVKEKHSARGRESPRADRPIGNMARDHNAGEQSEPHAARMGELLPSRNRQQGVSGARCLRGDAVAPVVALQAQSQATKGRELSTLAPLRALRARTSDPAWARRAVDEGVRSCPRAGCGKSAATYRRDLGKKTAKLRVLACPFPISTFEVKRHWHERYHAEPRNRWLRGVIAELFQKTEVA